jgi:hypothetical protein
VIEYVQPRGGSPLAQQLHHRSLSHRCGLEWTIDAFFNFSILLEVHNGQFGITFDKHAEVHLIDRK